ncbi:hypothetical protein F4860DRAFT_42240 [Xylaria cubensis]|nr:hypothetical protein F4860DRAFT_42240 [Xylaria cubensis]
MAAAWFVQVLVLGAATNGRTLDYSDVSKFAVLGRATPPSINHAFPVPGFWPDGCSLASSISMSACTGSLKWLTGVGA